MILNYFKIPQEQVNVSTPALIETPAKESVIDELLESPSSSSEDEHAPASFLPNVELPDKEFLSSKTLLPDRQTVSPKPSSDEEDWEVGTLQDRKLVWRRILGNLWNYECRSIALDQLDSRGHEFKRFFERRRNKLVGHPDEIQSEDEDFMETYEEKKVRAEKGLNELDQKKACRVICFHSGTKNIFRTIKFTHFDICKLVVFFEKQIEKLFMNGRLFEQNSEYVEKFVMQRRDQIWNEIKKLAESFECRGGKWINICKSISACSSNSFDNRNDW